VKRGPNVTGEARDRIVGVIHALAKELGLKPYTVANVAESALNTERKRSGSAS
jgi:hypothetical protein